MRLTNVLLATKKTAFEYYEYEGMEIKNALSPCDLEIIAESHEEHHATVGHVKKVLYNAGISYEEVYAYTSAHEKFQNRDLIISLGGDGTLLSTAYHIYDTTPVLPIKSDKRSRGALCTVKKDEFASVLENILRDEAVLEKWTRIEGNFGRHRDLALNEIVVGPRFRPQRARYEICLNHICEEQSSSGVIVTTGAGSTGWYANIARSDGRFPRTEKALRFIATEYWSDCDYRLIKGTIGKGEMLVFRSLMNFDGIVSFDGNTETRLYPFFRGQTLLVKIAEEPLHVIVS